MADLALALESLRRARKYARSADTDYEQAQESVTDASADLLEAIAEHLLNGDGGIHVGSRVTLVQWPGKRLVYGDTGTIDEINPVTGMYWVEFDRFPGERFNIARSEFVLDNQARKR